MWIFFIVFGVCLIVYPLAAVFVALLFAAYIAYVHIRIVIEGSIETRREAKRKEEIELMRGAYFRKHPDKAKKGA